MPVGTDTVDAPLPSTIQQRADVVSSVLEKMSVSNVRNSLVFNISISTQSPWKSAEIADTIAQLYIRDQIDVKYEATEQATRWLTGRVAELRTALEVAERKISDFSAATQLISPRVFNRSNGRSNICVTGSGLLKKLTPRSLHN
ncbi:hypothetical protein [Sulfitobacter aestuariivivens]|uniref:hypothetical protein n=1 Tax=Sulfitobacter aestuariivivens TaxID=2766981 RepID=UPI00360CB77B